MLWDMAVSSRRWDAAVAAGGGEITVWDMATLGLSRSFQAQAEPTMVAAYAPDGVRLVTASRYRTVPLLWDATRGEKIMHFQGGEIMIDNKLCCKKERLENL